MSYVNFIQTPPGFEILHNELVDQITTWFAQQELNIEKATDDSQDALPIVTILNRSRVASDIKRELAKVKGS